MLAVDANNSRAIQRLGLAHYQLGEFGEAYRDLRMSEELAPDNLDVRLELGTIGPQPSRRPNISWGQTRHGASWPSCVTTDAIKAGMMPTSNG